MNIDRQNFDELVSRAMSDSYVSHMRPVVYDRALGKAAFYAAQVSVRRGDDSIARTHQNLVAKFTIPLEGYRYLFI